MVEIKGLEKFAPKDFPGFISSTVFLGGCNFRCPFCHNADLVLRPETVPTIPMNYFLSYIDSRKNWLDGIMTAIIPAIKMIIDDNHWITIIA